MVLRDWKRRTATASIAAQLSALRSEGVDYVRLEYNLGSADGVGGAARLANDTRMRAGRGCDLPGSGDGAPGGGTILFNPQEYDDECSLIFSVSDKARNRRMSVDFKYH